MKLLKQMFALTIVFAMLGASTHNLSAQDSQNQGNGYEDSSKASGIAPLVALSAIAVLAIVTVAITTYSHDHHHGHSSSSSSSSSSN